MNVLIFDIETIPDVASGRRLYELEGLSDADVAKVMFHKRREETGDSEFLRHHLHRVVAISVALRHADQLRVHNWRCELGRGGNHPALLRGQSARRPAGARGQSAHRGVAAVPPSRRVDGRVRAISAHHRRRAQAPQGDAHAGGVAAQRVPGAAYLSSRRRRKIGLVVRAGYTHRNPSDDAYRKSRVEFYRESMEENLRDRRLDAPSTAPSFALFGVSGVGASRRPSSARCRSCRSSCATKSIISCRWSG